MPTFLATSPDGRKFRITAPEGATKEQLEAYAQKNLPAAPEQPGAPQSKLDILKQWWKEIPEGSGLLGAIKALPNTLQTSLPPSSEKGFVPTNPSKPQDLARIGATTELAGLGVGASPASSTRMVTPKGLPAPTSQALKQAARSDYKAMEKAGMIKGQAVHDLYKGIMDHLKDRSFRDYLAPKTFRAVEELKPTIDELTMHAEPVHVMDIEAVHQLLGNVSGDRADATAAGIARQLINEYLTHMPESDMTAGTPKDMIETFRRARGNWGAAARSDTLQKAVRKAERQAGSTGSGANINNALRQQVRQILDKVDEKKLRGFSSDEIKAMNDIVKGTPSANAARWVGKYAPTGVVSLVPTVLGTTAGGPAVGAAVGGTGYLTKWIGDYMTRKSASKLDELLRSRSPLAGPRPEPQPSAIDAYLRKFYPAATSGALSQDQQ